MFLTIKLCKVSNIPKMGSLFLPFTNKDVGQHHCMGAMSQKENLMSIGMAMTFILQLQTSLSHAIIHDS